MTVYARLTEWLARRRAERYYFAMDRAAGHMLNDYRRAVERGDSREVLAGILTGIAGCELATSRTNPAMGWGMEPDEDGCTVGESSRRAGLLVLEVAYAAGEAEYSGVRAVEFQRADIAVAFTNLALVYRGWAPNPRGNLGSPGEPVPIGQRLDDVWHVVVDVIGAQAAQVLVPLMAAHGHNPYAEDDFPAGTCPLCRPDVDQPHPIPLGVPYRCLTCGLVWVDEAGDPRDPVVTAISGAVADARDARDWGDGPTGDEFVDPLEAVRGLPPDDPRAPSGVHASCGEMTNERYDRWYRDVFEPHEDSDQDDGHPGVGGVVA